METPETSELDESLITEEAREFATQLFSRFPEFRRYAAMERTLSGEEWTLVVRVPAPSTVPQSELVVWVNDGEEPSVAFAEWHTHEDLDDSDDLLDLIEGILQERFLVCRNVGSRSDGTMCLLDVREEDAVLDQLTRPDSSSRATLRSWTGRLDRAVSLDDWSPEKPR